MYGLGYGLGPAHELIWPLTLIISIDLNHTYRYVTNLYYLDRNYGPFMKFVVMVHLWS